MARGWESKAVEAQQADHERRERRAAPLSADEAARRVRRRTLELSRARAAADRARATSPAHRAMLDAALEALDAELADLDRGPAADSIE